MVKIFRNNFNYRVLLTLNCLKQGNPGINSFWHAKFQVKIFSEFFHLQSALDSEFFRDGLQSLTFFSDNKFEVKFIAIFSFTEHSGL